MKRLFTPEVFLSTGGIYFYIRKKKKEKKSLLLLLKTKVFDCSSNLTKQIINRINKQLKIAC